MIFTVCLTQVFEISYTIGNGLDLTYKSTHNVTDFIKCNDAFYQISPSGILQAKGQKVGLIDARGKIDFINTSIVDVIQVFCKKNDFAPGAQPYLVGYVTKTGEVKVESTDKLTGKLTFDRMYSIPNGVKKIITVDDITFAVTNDGLYAYGLCPEYTCGFKSEFTFEQFTKIPIPVLPSEIHSVSYNYFLFIQAKNGDVYAIGNNENDFLPAEKYPDEQLVEKQETEQKISSWVIIKVLQKQVSITQKKGIWLCLTVTAHQVLLLLSMVHMIFSSSSTLSSLKTNLLKYWQKHHWNQNIQNCTAI
ncbi:Regulator_of chromosome condensation 1/beta-lactamase-inhibitor protein II [Hexamita inflata]|uniref:Regulator of chromosome condensation 1/beta-lactamase-inhibitor protein II n=1 Tax=Hexamita inflata TaxID=28002 RepID=A0AA86NSY5_9EUKA|nr:Regulator of chromosome condensation 1/beta-lactamase-inhibitor protein II [Hexamita inflata]